jgi:hypothetical protein
MTTELDQLGGMVAATDNEAATASAPPKDPNAPPEPEVLTSEQEAARQVDTIGALICGYADKAAPLWTKEKKEQYVKVWTPLVEKYNFSLSALPPELVAAFVLGPALAMSAKAVIDQVKEDKAMAAAMLGKNPAAPAAAAKSDEGPKAEVHSQMGLYPQ